MKSDKLSVNSLLFFFLLSTEIWLSVCSLLPINQWKAALKKRGEKKNAWNVIHVINLLFCCTQSATLFFLFWPWTVMNPVSTQRSPSSPEVAPWFAPPGLFCKIRGMLTPCVDPGALWDCLLTSRLPRLVMRGAFPPANSFLLLKCGWCTHHPKPASLSEQQQLQMAALCVEACWNLR